MRTFYINGNPGIGFPIVSGDGKGAGDTVYFAPVTISPHMSQDVELDFQDFFKLKDGSGARSNLWNTSFELLFSDGSEIKFTPLSTS
jgi:hypothetical protein